MSVQYAPTRLKIPEGFQALLEGLAREVLREQPSDILKFSADYFKNRLALREGAPISTSNKAQYDSGEQGLEINQPNFEKLGIGKGKADKEKKYIEKDLSVSLKRANQLKFKNDGVPEKTSENDHFSTVNKKANGNKSSNKKASIKNKHSYEISNSVKSSISGREKIFDSAKDSFSNQTSSLSKVSNHWSDEFNATENDVSGDENPFIEKDLPSDD